jgi:hypothetical protein
LKSECKISHSLLISSYNHCFQPIASKVRLVVPKISQWFHYHEPSCYQITNYLDYMKLCVLIHQLHQPQGKDRTPMDKIELSSQILMSHIWKCISNYCRMFLSRTSPIYHSLMWQLCSHILDEPMRHSSKDLDAQYWIQYQYQLNGMYSKQWPNHPTFYKPWRHHHCQQWPILFQRNRISYRWSYPYVQYHGMAFIHSFFNMTRKNILSILSMGVRSFPCSWCSWWISTHNFI